MTLSTTTMIDSKDKIQLKTRFDCMRHQRQEQRGNNQRIFIRSNSTRMRLILTLIVIVTTTIWSTTMRKSSSSSSSLSSSSSQSTPLGTVTVIDGGWKRISPSPVTTKTDKTGDYGDDGILVGRSCQWRPHSTIQILLRRFIYFPIAVVFLQSRPPITGHWVCRDCGDRSSNNVEGEDIRSTSLYSTWDECPILIPRGKCPEFGFQPWNGPKPRSTSFSASSVQPLGPPMHLLTAFGVGTPLKLEYEQPQCHYDHRSYNHQHVGWSSRCFDLRKCQLGHQATRSRDKRNTTESMSLRSSINIYAHEGKARTDVKQAMNIIMQQNEKAERLSTWSTHPSQVKLNFVDDPDDACLLIVHVDDLLQAKTINSHVWNHGRNHYVYGIVEPITSSPKYVHFDYASVGSIAWTHDHIRLGYDVAVPLPAKWHPPPPRQSKDTGRRLEQNTNDVAVGEAVDWLDDSLLHRQRKYLMTFQGSIQDTLQPYYQHRWIASEYIFRSQDSDVIIDVQCKHKTMWGDRSLIKPYDDTNPEHFDEMMIQSTFAFCPGGSQVTSYRFTEVLSVGSIPVITPEIITPFAPELDWSSCVVRISQSRIIDLPRILRSISSDEIQRRQKECRRLYRYIANDNANDESQKSTIYMNLSPKSEKEQSINAMVTTLRVWAARINLLQHNNDFLSGLFG